MEAGFIRDGRIVPPLGPDGLLNGMRTFHWFSLPDMKHLNDMDKGSGPDRRLFFKCETYGIYFSTIHAKRSAKAASRSEGLRTRWYAFGDVCESIAHCASLLVSRWTSKTREGIRKEDVPLAVGSAMVEAVDALRARGMGEIAQGLLVGGVLEGGGVRQFLENLELAVRNLPDAQTDAFLDVMSPFLTRIDDALKPLAGDVTLRMGNEIMLDAQDFGVAL